MNLGMKVYGLLGRFDYEINLNNQNGIIIIGENGKGKTALLTLFYGILNKVFSLVYQTPFEKVVVFLNEETIEITRDDFDSYYFDIERNSRLINRFVREEIRTNEDLETRFFKLRRNNDEHLLHSINDRNLHIITNDAILMQEYINYVSTLEEEEEKNLNKKLLDDMQKISEIIKRMNLKILFLPVSRVVENKNTLNRSNLHSLETIELAIKEKLDNYQRELNKANQAIYTNLFDYLLSNNPKQKTTVEVNGEKNIEKIIDKLSDLESIKANQEKLKRIVNLEDDSDTKNIIIDFLISMDKEFDSKLKRIGDEFIILAKEANKFLKNSKKGFYFNKNEVTFELKDEKNKTVGLTDLSSGESHLIKILCELYLLTDNQKILVIIDEPELSLSISWQEMLINSIVTSPKYFSMLAATHSPFILGEQKNHLTMLKSIDNLVISNE